MVFVLLCNVWSSPNMALCIIAKSLQFGLVCPKVIVPEVLWFPQMQLHKPKLYCSVYLFLVFFALSNETMLFSLIVLSRSLTFNMLSEAYIF